MRPNADFLRWLLNRHRAHGARTELRALEPRPDGGRVVWSGLFGPEDLPHILLALEDHGMPPRRQVPANSQPRSGEANLYFSMQGVDPACAWGVPGRLVRTQISSRDRDIFAYGLFAVDVDPIRPSGVSATDGEKAAALALARRVLSAFAERGVNAVMADSGNGYHLLVPVPAMFGPDVARASVLAHLLLKHLDRRFSNGHAKIDTAIFNPSRILKLYGTLALKGEDTAERPHRPSWVDWPEDPEPTPIFERFAEEIEAFKESGGRRGDATPPRTLRPPQGSPLRPAGDTRDLGSERWRGWRAQALANLPLDQIYGDLLTGRSSGDGWLECRDPASPTGDAHPSAGVADGSGEAERGAFHSFRTGETMSVFDVLYAFGRAADFDEARRIVADLSGIPQPAGGATRPSSTESHGQRPEAFVRQALSMTAGLEPAPTEAPEDPPAQRAVVDFVTNVETVAALFDRLLAALRPLGRLFASESGMVWISPGHGPVAVTDRILPGLLSGHLDLRLLRAVGDERRLTRFAVLPFELARSFVSDPRVRASLPRLALYTRTPLFLEGWSLCATRGYEPSRGGVYYDGPDIPPVSEPLTLLDSLLEGFQWMGPADRVAALGVMLTAVTLPLWGRGHPFVAINGNRPGCGKTTLARLLGVIAEGRDPATVTFTGDDAELEKQLATRVECGDRFIVLDNVKASGPLSSPVLERSITDGRPTFRRLGSNTAISRPTNDLLFCLTMNHTRLGPDLLRRVLPIHLNLEGDPRRARYANEDVVGLALDQRPALLGALIALVSGWLEAGSPLPEGLPGHSAGPVWARTIGGILLHHGRPGFLANMDDAERIFDPDHELLGEVAAHFAGEAPAFAADWVAPLEAVGVEDLFRDRAGRPKSQRGKATAVGRLFASRVGQRFEVDGVQYELIRELPRGPGWKALYGFKALP